MPVVSMVSSKGGAGKTTTALILAGEFAEAGKTVTLVDADPNRPIEAWSKRGEVPKNIRVTVDEDADTIIDTIDAERKRSHFVIVDLEGTLELSALKRFRWELARIAESSRVPEYRLDLINDRGSNDYRDLEAEGFEFPTTGLTQLQRLIVVLKPVRRARAVVDRR